ncbi:hypothetical protein [Allomuricauda sp. F6463D]|uniref:hypothetical protein n=1 Tax=Allomuricauda sp. F6463D TaxID=2926409 RepID=UPI001FF11027|nr:hypothetical protein [Muricauda sp. F6463D]MCK0161636.1 hypothetical protein [Muricauda sp. F6463D]
MKSNYKYILGLVLLLLGFIACEDKDKNPLNVFELEDSAAPYVRILLDQSIVAKGDLATSSLLGTVDDPSDNVASWDLSVTLESGGVSTDTVPLTTITQFPSDISIPYTEIASSLGITVDDISGGDFIRFLGKSTGVDGTETTVENYSATVTGQPEQLQAFNFIVLVKCSPISGTTVPGTWVIEMQDLFGDGWDGAFVTFEIDGVTTDYTFTSGDTATFNVDVPDDNAELVISYTSGAFEEEHVYTIETPDGEVLGPFGPNPSPCIN